MTMTGPLQLGAVQVVSPTGEVIGFAFTTASGKGQMQRWLLYKDPGNALEVRPPPADKAGWTLADWQANVPSLWKPNSYYVWAQADVYEYGVTYGNHRWTTIPSNLPQATYPKVPGLEPHAQLDPDPWKLIFVKQLMVQGLVFTDGGMRHPSNVEYWMLPSGYKGAGATAASVATSTEDVRSLEGFVGAANQSWGAGCSFVVIGCINYTGEIAHAAP
jgi:hypothetical protein